MSGAGHIRVLLVDDEEDIRLVMRVGIDLANEDLVVVGEAADGQSALDLADELDPTIVVLDQRMPGLSGIETGAQLLARRPGQRMVLCSAFLDDRLRAEATAAGLSTCIRKDEIPNLPELLRAMARAA